MKNSYRQTVTCVAIISLALLGFAASPANATTVGFSDRTENAPSKVDESYFSRRDQRPTMLLGDAKVKSQDKKAASHETTPSAEVKQPGANR